MSADQNANLKLAVVTEQDLPRPVVSGVYFLFKDQALTYTGKSHDVYGRINSHRSKGRPFDYALVAGCPEIDAGWIEAAMIKQLAPPENKVGVSKKIVDRLRLIESLPPSPPTAGSDVLPAEEDMLIAKARAAKYARHYRLSGALPAALSSGDLASRRERAGGAILIRVGDLKAWVKGRVAARE